MNMLPIPTLALAAVALFAPAAVAGADDLDSAWFELEQEYEEALDGWRAEIAEWREAREEDPELPLPKSPAAGFYPRFHALGAKGQGNAKLWCLQNFNAAGDAGGMANKLRLCLDLVENHSREEWAVDLVLAISRQSGDYPGYLGQSVAFGLMDDIVARNDETEVEVNVLYSKGRTLERSDDEQEAEQGRALFRTLRDEHGQHELGQRAGGFLFRDEKLQVGMQCPDFTSKDVDGNEIKLSDYRGRVVVIDFWGFW